MKKRLKAFVAVAAMLTLSAGFLPGTTSASGPLVVADLSSQTSADLVTALVGAGVSVSNIAYQGTSISAGTFTGGTGVVGFEEGVILSSGRAADVVGPNNYGSNKSTTLGTSGDAALGALVSKTTYDATVLSFDFVPNADTIHWQYVFSSEEYNEYVGSNFNDVFGFFLNGGNVALVPGTSDIVSVNSVNAGSNATYYVNNQFGVVNTSMDGLTVVLTISAPVNKDQVNHIKLAIADASDQIIDSNVFIKKGSFSTTAPPCTTAPSLSWESPLSATTPASVIAGATFPIDFRWTTCTGSSFDKSVSVRVRDNVTNRLIAGYTLNYDIAYNAGTGVYSQPFNTAIHSIPAGSQLKVMVYFNSRLRGTALVNVN